MTDRKERVTYSAKVWNDLLGHIASGESLRTACKHDGMPTKKTVMQWLAKDEGLRPSYADACALRAEVYAEEIVDIADEADVEVIVGDDGEQIVKLDATAVARNRLRVDARKWIACKLVPKKYGERQTHEHQGRIGLETLIAGSGEDS